MINESAFELVNVIFFGINFMLLVMGNDMKAM